MWRFYSETYECRNGELFFLTVSHITLAVWPGISAFNDTVLLGSFLRASFKLQKGGDLKYTVAL